MADPAALKDEIKQVFKVQGKQLPPWSKEIDASGAIADEILGGPLMALLLRESEHMALYVTQLAIPVPDDPYHPLIVARSERHQGGPHWAIADRTDLGRAFYWTVSQGWVDRRYLKHDEAFYLPRLGAIELALKLAETGDVSHKRERF